MKRIHCALTVGLAGVWLVHGIWCKLFGKVARHRDIVARAVGESQARVVTLMVGGIEVMIAAWILSGAQMRLCALAQTCLLVSMNIFEVWLARDLLLAPWPMLMANTAFLSFAWWWAIYS